MHAELFPKSYIRKSQQIDDISSLGTSNLTSSVLSQYTFLPKKINNITAEKIEAEINFNLMKNSTKKPTTAGSTAQQPPQKVGRVKVGIRCRPAFQDEIDFAQGNFLSIVETKPEKPEQNMMGQVSLALISGKQRDFFFDYAFGADCNQDSVYDRIARPVVTDVLKGFNGTIFAYGQTGTGKTYTMGILEFINNEHAGIIPRAVAQIFDYVETIQSQSPFTEVIITLSFLQLYRETIQDLLSPLNSENRINSTDNSDKLVHQHDNLPIREDPTRGFYVEGLQVFTVRSYSEAEILLNLGLENRATASTLMNATSSRSHTVLTISIEQRHTSGSAQNNGNNSNGAYARTVRSKLLMVDLAGSERVRRTVSKGARLSEAKSINTSLSALGNVIAALADPNSGHVPYRDSKLTRLLQDSLGGTSSTALIATVGPAAVNYGETLSTLQFASRCLYVKVVPVLHEEIDYADMCVRLQERLGGMEAEMNLKLVEQQERYEGTIRELRAKIQASSRRQEAPRQAVAPGVDDLVQRLISLQSTVPASDGQGQGQGQGQGRAKDGVADGRDTTVLTLTSFIHNTLTQLIRLTGELMKQNIVREDVMKSQLQELLVVETKREEETKRERAALCSEDPKPGGAKGHLAPLTRSGALLRIEGQYPSNIDVPVTSSDRTDDKASPYQAVSLPDSLHAAVSSSEEYVKRSLKQPLSRLSLPSTMALLGDMVLMVEHNLDLVQELLRRKDEHYSSIKRDLSSQLLEKRQREEEVVNWSFILKYLLQSNSQLRFQARGQDGPPPPRISRHKQRNNSESSDSPQLFSRPSPLLRPLATAPSPSPSPSSLGFSQSHSFQADDIYDEDKSLSASDITVSVASARPTLYTGPVVERKTISVSNQFQKHIPASIPSSKEMAHQSLNSPVQTSSSTIPTQPSTQASAFAKSVVQDLGVDKSQTAAAVSIVDRIAKITPKQLSLLDPETREQVQQIRRDLGLDAVQSSQRPAAPKRSSSAPPIRPSRSPPPRSAAPGVIAAPPMIDLSSHRTVLRNQPPPPPPQPPQPPVRASQPPASRRDYKPAVPVHQYSHHADADDDDDDDDYSQLDDLEDGC